MINIIKVIAFVLQFIIEYTILLLFRYNNYLTNDKAKLLLYG